MCSYKYFAQNPIRVGCIREENNNPFEELRICSCRRLYKWFGKKVTNTSCLYRRSQQLSEAVAYKIIFHDLSHVLWDGLYVGEPSSSRIEPFTQELERNLLIISNTIHDRVRTRIVTDIMRASFDGFLFVLLARGPSRAFTLRDSQIIEDDFNSLKDLFWAHGDGLPADLIDKFSTSQKYPSPSQNRYRESS
jgi:hypothetical protein